MQKTLLLDIDGVLFRNKAAAQHIKHKAIRYVQKVIPRDLTYNEASKFNNYLYTYFGHTNRGLKHFINNKYTYKEFNDYIYNNDSMILLKHFIDKDTMLDRVKDNLDKFRYIFPDIDIYIYTNAPLQWSYPICQKINSQYFTEDKILDLGEFVKPDREAYEIVEERIQGKIYFVDDQLINHIPIMHKTNWTSILWGEDYEYVRTPNIYNATTFEKVATFL